MEFENKNTAHAVCSSTGGKREQVCNGLVSVLSILEAARPVKGGGGFNGHRARRLAAMLTDSQRRDVLRLAMAIVSNRDE